MLMTFLETKDILTLRKPRSQRVSVSPRPAEVISFCKSKTSYVNKLVRTHGLLFGHWQPTFCVECTLHINVGQGKTVIGCNGLDVFSPDVFSTGACQAMTFQVWRPCARKSSRRSSHSRGWRSIIYCIYIYIFLLLFFLSFLLLIASQFLLLPGFKCRRNCYSLFWTGYSVGWGRDA